MFSSYFHCTQPPQPNIWTKTRKLLVAIAQKLDLIEQNQCDFWIHPKSIQIDTNAQIPYNWASSLANSVDQNCERAFQTSYSIRLSARYMKHRNLRLSVETKQGRKTSGASKICSIFCIKYIDLSVVLTYRQEKKTCSALILFKMRISHALKNCIAI